MCRGEKVAINKNTVRKSVKDIVEIAEKGNLQTITTSGAGEALLFKEFVALLASRTLSDRGIEVIINTNLTALTEKLWERIKHNNLTIVASVDGATKETYERIRVGARWEDVYRNLGMIARKHKLGELNKLILSFIIMNSNKADISKIIKLACDLEITLTFSQHYGLSTVEENIFECCDIDALDSIYDLIEGAGGFRMKHVNLGSAWMLINRSYRGAPYRINCARYQISRRGRRDIAARILGRAIDDIASNALKVERSKELEILDLFATVTAPAIESERPSV